MWDEITKVRYNLDKKLNEELFFAIHSLREIASNGLSPTERLFIRQPSTLAMQFNCQPTSLLQ